MTLEEFQNSFKKSYRWDRRMNFAISWLMILSGIAMTIVLWDRVVEGDVKVLLLSLFLICAGLLISSTLKHKYHFSRFGNGLNTLENEALIRDLLVNFFNETDIDAVNPNCFIW